MQRVGDSNLYYNYLIFNVINSPNQKKCTFTLFLVCNIPNLISMTKATKICFYFDRFLARFFDESKFFFKKIDSAKLIVEIFF